MRIAVMGTGGVGGYFGARLAQAGNEVAFIARGRHLEALRSTGLRVKSPLGDVHLPRPVAAEDPASLGRFEVVLFAVKLWDTEAAAAMVGPALAAGGVVVPFQNGLESIERIGAVVGAARVMGGAAYIMARIAEPGLIEQTGSVARLRFGAVLPEQAAAAGALHRACVAAGIDAELVADVARMLWEKFVFLAALSGLTTVARSPIGVVRADPDLRATFEAAMREAWQVGRARGVALDDDFVAQQMAFGDRLPREVKSSMLHDLEAGRRLEAPWLAGAVARMAREAGAYAPVNATIHAALKPFCDGHAH
ncbi:MAG: ketopantoate reductase family protein [Casimicrobiaceae bacterium]